MLSMLGFSTDIAGRRTKIVAGSDAWLSNQWNVGVYCSGPIGSRRSTHCQVSQMGQVRLIRWYHLAVRSPVCRDAPEAH